MSCKSMISNITMVHNKQKWHKTLTAACRQILIHYTSVDTKALVKEYDSISPKFNIGLK